eukprot:EG_transcript_19265
MKQKEISGDKLPPSFIFFPQPPSFDDDDCARGEDGSMRCGCTEGCDGLERSASEEVQWHEQYKGDSLKASSVHGGKHTGTRWDQVMLNTCSGEQVGAVSKSNAPCAVPRRRCSEE